jgi:hypothetical protein
VFLGKSRTQDLLIRTATRAAPSEFGVNRDGGHAADTIPLRLGCSLRLVHVMDDYLVGRPSEAFDNVYSFFTRWASSAEDFNLLCSHDVLLSIVFDFVCVAAKRNAISRPQRSSK